MKADDCSSIYRPTWILVGFGVGGDGPAVASGTSVDVVLIANTITRCSLDLPESLLPLIPPSYASTMEPGAEEPVMPPTVEKFDSSSLIAFKIIFDKSPLIIAWLNTLLLPSYR